MKRYFLTTVMMDTRISETKEFRGSYYRAIDSAAGLPSSYCFSLVLSWKTSHFSNAGRHLYQ